MRRVRLAIITVGVLGILFAHPVGSLAQKLTMSVARSLFLIDTNAKDGDIVTVGTKGYGLSRAEYDARMIGVIADKPALVLDTNDATPAGTRKFFVLSEGPAMVNVSAASGTIKKGDPVTSSKTAGVGILATHPGYIIGQALESYNPPQKSKVQKIQVEVQIRYYTPPGTVGSNLLQLFSLSSLGAYEQPLSVLRYIIAAIIAISSILFAFYFFGRIASRGIEALGRNPLASRRIQFGIILNVLITITIIVSGIAVAYLILIL